jgi:hypothetical protein
MRSGAAPTDLENALLRSVDWRFLLPHPEPQVAALSEAASLRQAIGLVTNSVRDLEAARDCDLVVVDNPDHSQLAAAYAALRPGGWCYAEWPQTVIGSTARLNALLKSVGFCDSACYWPARTFTRLPLAWVPLDATGALRHFWRMRTVRCARNRFGLVLRQLIWRAARSAGLIGPVGAIARRPLGPGSDPAGQTPALLDFVRINWADWGLGHPPARLSCLLLTGGNRSISKCVALVFAEPDPEPRLAIKFARVPRAVRALKKEEEALTALHSRHGPITGVPRALSTSAYQSPGLLIETPLVGVPLNRVVCRANFQELATKAADWLAGFAQRTNRGPSINWRMHIAEPAMSAFVDSFGTVADPTLLHRTADDLAAVGPLPLVAEQRDFSPWNVLIDPHDAFNVLDWESADLDGMPGADLLYFVTYLAFAAENVPIDAASPRLRAAYRRLLDPTSFSGAVRLQCLSRYAAGLKLHPDQLQRLAGLTWLIHARSDYSRFCEDARGPPEPHVLRRSVFLALWEEEMRRPIPHADDLGPAA